jgi:pSer/pThr/pTyr-binding forkhead associated (FHA) protein
MASLRILTGARAGETLDLTGPVEIGRAADGLAVEDERMSRRHLVVRPLEGGGLEVEDLGSTNGTWIDDRRIEGPVQVEMATKVVAGETELLVEPDVATSPKSSATVIGQRMPAATVIGAPSPAASGGTITGAAPVAADAPPPPPPPPAAVAPPPPAPAPPPPPAAPAPAPAAGAAPFAPPRPADPGAPAFMPTERYRGHAATRLLWPQIVSYLIVAGTAAGVIAYFAGR